MKRALPIALILAGCLVAAAELCAQTPPPANPTSPAQNKQPAQKPAATPPTSSSNPFPEDTSTVPVFTPNPVQDLPEGAYSGSAALPAEDLDPVRSPDAPGPGASNAVDSGSSSSTAGLDSLLPDPDPDDTTSAHRKMKVEEPKHQETATEDLSVGKYYLDSKNWKAALSRFQSAMVLDPEEPEVYWGLAESDRHLGRLAEARANYQKVLDYDPDGKHGKEAKKALKDPEIANAKASSPAQAPSISQQ
jgi:hypothetical protein